MIDAQYGNLHFCARTGDLLQATTDVIVNPANVYLAHGGGLARQILMSAGPALNQASRTYIAEHGPLETGEAVFTTAGKLPFRAVIHVAGPRQGDGNEEAMLTLAMHNVFRLMIDQGWQSVALPAISTGIFGVPIATFARACAIALDSAQDITGIDQVKQVELILAPALCDEFVASFTGR